MFSRHSQIPQIYLEEITTTSTHQPLDTRIMVRYSKKEKILRTLRKLSNERSSGVFIRNVLMSDSSNSDGDSFTSSEDDMECLRDMILGDAIDKIGQSRYLFHAEKYRDRRKSFSWRNCIKESRKRFSSDEFQWIFERHETR